MDQLCEVILGKEPLLPPALRRDLEAFMSWADDIRHLNVMANANTDTPDDALAARNNGAEEIGLCRTEHVVMANANADTLEDALATRNNGAEGIGLCRTEHMFFASDDRIKDVRKMIMAVTLEQRKVALGQLLPYQRSDFEGIFHAMDGLPVTINNVLQKGLKICVSAQVFKIIIQKFYI